jgi:hypothetical protein
MFNFSRLNFFKTFMLKIDNYLPSNVVSLLQIN